MGFITQTNFSASPSLGNNADASPPTGTIAAPSGLEAGDMLLVIQATSGSPTTALTTLTGGAGTAWTNILDHQMAGFSLGGNNGRVRVDYRQATSADLGATFTLSTTGGSAICCHIVAIRSTDASYASLALTLRFNQEFAAATSFSMPQLSVVNPTDLRIIFADHNAGGSMTPPKETGPNSPWSVGIWQQWGQVQGSTGRRIEVFAANHTTASDSGTTTWTSNVSEATYFIGIDISDGTSNDPTIAESPDYLVETVAVIIPAIAESHDSTLTVDSVTGRGGGSGISVY